MELRCAICGVQACAAEAGAKQIPAYCAMTQEPDLLAGVRDVYGQDDETRRLALAAAQVEAEGYLRWPRAQEIMVFARKLGVTTLGVATCIGLVRESRLLQDILEANGFTVLTVCCKVGGIPKEEVGLTDAQKIHPGQFEALCSPVAQAELLNKAGSGLNIVVGLCVGHDSIFFRYSRAPVTVLVAKDRVTGNNPAAALYTSHSYFRRLREG